MAETITAEQWREKSKRGEVCGILGCFAYPETKCPHCGCHYCQHHKFVIDTLAHKIKRQDVGDEHSDPVREAILERADLERRTIPRPQIKRKGKT